MKKVVRIFASSAVLLLALAGCASSPADSTSSIPGVRSLDMDRYFGKWYEISRIPVPIGRSWVNTSDTYSPGPDGSIKVVYEGFVKTPAGKRRTLTARQWIPDPAVMGDMKGSFLPLVVSDNRVVAVDEDYAWLVVTSSTKDYLWIMSRTPRHGRGCVRLRRGEGRGLGLRYLAPGESPAGVAVRRRGRAIPALLAAPHGPVT